MTQTMNARPTPLTEINHIWPTLTAVAVNDLLVDDGAGYAKKASQLTYASEAAAMALLAQNFVGLANMARTALDVQQDEFPVALGRERVMDCTSATFEVGDLLGGVANGGGTALENQKLQKVYSHDMAVAVVTKRYASATTRVQCTFLRKKPQLQSQQGFLPMFQGAATVVNTAGNTTLAVTANPIQAIDPNGAGRDVTLPAASAWRNRALFIKNTADAAETITVKDDAAATINTLAQNTSGLYISSGAAWYALKALHT